MWPFKSKAEKQNIYNLERQRVEENDLKILARYNAILPDDEYTEEHLFYILDQNFHGGHYLQSGERWALSNPRVGRVYEIGFERIATWNKEENKPNPVIWRRKKKDVSEAMHYEVDQYTGDDYLCGSRTNDRLLH